jgi:cysteinyl-tRNA synthetase
MSMKYLGNRLDIHCGGTDHIDVHHTNEIAQSEAATGKPFFNFWLHGEFLNIAGGKKMAKSEGNFLTLETSLVKQGFDPLAYRFATFQTHYRKPMEYSLEAIQAARNGLMHLRNQVRTLAEKSAPTQADSGFLGKFKETLNNDLNMPRALAVVQELLKSDLAAGSKLATVIACDQVLGLDLDKVGERPSLPADIQDLVDARQKARETKDWAESDKLRDAIQALGYVVQDGPQGMKVFKV